MDKIGIKLADGTFYPILEDGKPEKKSVSLTTVKDNQTTVHVDLFRSPSGMMQDAQYIDTLEINNLNPHANGDPSLSFDIELGEDGELSAGIQDPETGGRSSRRVSLSALAGAAAEKFPTHESDLSVKDGRRDGLEEIAGIEEPIELGKPRGRDGSSDAGLMDDGKDIEDIFRSGDRDDTAADKKADSSFEDIVKDISNIGRDSDFQEASRMIGPSPNSESFSFDDFAADAERSAAEPEATPAGEPLEAARDEVADESMEEISAEEALPKDAEYVDSSGDEELDSLDTLGALDAGADLPDFGFKDLADAEDADKTSGTPKAGGADAPDAAGSGDGFEELGTLPDWNTGGLDKLDDDDDLRSLPVFADDDEEEERERQEQLAQQREDEEKTAVNDDNLEQENKELSSFSGDAALAAVGGGDGGSPDSGSVSEGAQDSDDFAGLDLPSLNLFENESFGGADAVRSAPADDGFSALSSAVDDGASGADSGFDDDFDLPDLDFDDAVKEEGGLSDFDQGVSSSYTALGSALDDFDSTLSGAGEWPSLDLDSGSGSASSFTPSNMFDDLYDQETMEGKSSDGYEEEKNISRVPMFVCIACAIICVLCLFFLFVIPTRFNVLHRAGSQEIALNDRSAGRRPEGKAAVGGNSGPSADAAQDAGSQHGSSGSSSSAGLAGELIKPASPASVSAPLPKVESVPAKENEIVIASVPSVVVPETPVRNAKKLPDIQYTVVWGDTLWDIANAYYKNPWKYTELAEYNHLKNPNFIQTGSILLIPAE